MQHASSSSRRTVPSSLRCIEEKAIERKSWLGEENDGRREEKERERDDRHTGCTRSALSVMKLLLFVAGNYRNLVPGELLQNFCRTRCDADATRFCLD